jgi:hypothetical protein
MFTKFTLEKFWKNVKLGTAEECWAWLGGRTSKGYGEADRDGGACYAHRLSWMISNKQEIPVGLFVLHSCDNPSCVNPAHLHLGTAGDNAREMVTRGRWRGPVGEGHPHGKLKAGDVLKIRSLLEAGDTHRSIAARFNISHRAITDISLKRTWRHL